MRAVVIIINHKSELTTLEFLESLSRTEVFTDVAIVVVDNLSGEEGLSSIRQVAGQRPNVELLESAVNRGYFGAARFAFDHYLEQGNALPDWVIVCNHDVLIEDQDFFTKLFQEDPKTIGVIAPRVQSLPGRVDQNPFMRRRPSPLRWANLRLISSNYVAAALWDWLWRRKSEFRSWLAARRRNSLLDGNAKRESIYAAHGSFFIFSRRYFEVGGFLDGNLFLYGEEIAVAEICRSLSLPVVYEPSLCVLHQEHQSTGKVLSRFTYECQKRAMQYVTSRYLSRSPVPTGSCQPDLS